MYPFGDLPGNLAAFCGVLRREFGFRLGPGEINDAARVLQRIDLTDQQHVRDAWRTILSSSRETAIASLWYTVVSQLSAFPIVPASLLKRG